MMGIYNITSTPAFGGELCYKLADEFVSLCEEYGIAPELVAEDMLAAGLKSVSVEDVRTFIEENY
jgi:hypothetical protein